MNLMAIVKVRHRFSTPYYPQTKRRAKRDDGNVSYDDKISNEIDKDGETKTINCAPPSQNHPFPGPMRESDISKI